ncbi:MAG TPA: hypothetical protein VFM98_00785 [Ramlibacter sp.]|uniref:hypothetical protein n=1 Tax=Ramlibacter sp. TaxID=1917967 RepID=UPI002D7F2339|nr:hypothetical protein [Ramlibacter sp.]HET8744110.1 hypothetical protein [Ramlibacter sp.]
MITGYQETEISARLVKFQMHMQQTDVAVLCAETAKTKLDSVYDTYQFTAEKELMIKMQERMADKLIDIFADQLLALVQEFYAAQARNYKDALVEQLKRKA